MLLDVNTQDYLPNYFLKGIFLKMQNSYRRVMSIIDPSDGIPFIRGVIVKDYKDNLFYVDLTNIATPTAKEQTIIGPIGIRKLNGLPNKGIGNKRNPKEREELMSLLGDEAPANIQEDLEEFCGCIPKEKLPKNILSLING